MFGLKENLSDALNVLAVRNNGEISMPTIPGTIVWVRLKRYKDGTFDYLCKICNQTIRIEKEANCSIREHGMSHLEEHNLLPFV